MERGINVRRIPCKDLLEYDKKRKEYNATWDDINWEENELESGPGSEDCITHLKIVNDHPAWKELFEVQRKLPLSCDVNIIANGGYIPCHRMYLQQKSEFLDQLITDNLKVNQPGDKNVISITLMDVELESLKTVMTLLYTGGCVCVDSNEEDEVKDILRLLHVDVKKFKFVRENIDTKTKKKKFKTVKALRFQEVDVPSESPLKLGGPVGASCVGSVVDEHSASAALSASEPSGSKSQTCGSSVPGPSSSKSQVPGPSVPLVEELPLVSKVPSGTLVKKNTERLKRGPVDHQPSASTSVNRVPVDDDEDEDDGKSELPQVQKVKPGSLVPLNQQPRIVRAPLSKSGRGRGGKRRHGGRQTASTLNVDTEDSDTPKGKYEQDNDYVPSPGEVVEVDDDKTESEVLVSEDDEARPRTRNSLPKPVEEESGRKRKYPKRQLHKDDTKQESTTTKCSEEERRPVSTRYRTRAQGVSPQGLTGRNRMSRGSGNNEPNDEEDAAHQCCFCQKSFKTVEDLRTHLENSICARHLTDMYNLATKYCNTCQSFFKQYNAWDFMEHISVCVCSAKPCSKRRRTSEKSATSTQSPNRSEPPPPEQPPPPTDVNKKDKEKKFKSHMKKVHQRNLDIIGLTRVTLSIDRLSDEAISKVVKQIHHRRVVGFFRPNSAPGYTYIFPERNHETTGTAAATIATASTSATAFSNAATSTATSLTSGSSATVSATTSTSTSLPPTNRSLPSQPPDSQNSSGVINEITPSMTSNETTSGEKSIRYKPGPLSMKKKAMAIAEAKKRMSVPQDKENETLRPDPVRQKENYDPGTKGSSVATAPPTTGNKSQTSITAEKLRENLKKKLHPPTVIETTNISTVVGAISNQNVDNNANTSNSISGSSSTVSVSNRNLEGLQSANNAVPANGGSNDPSGQHAQQRPSSASDLVNQALNKMIHKSKETSLASQSQSTESQSQHTPALLSDSQDQRREGPPKTVHLEQNPVAPQTSQIAKPSMASVSMVATPLIRPRMNPPATSNQQHFLNQQNQKQVVPSIPPRQTLNIAGIPHTGISHLTQSQQVQLSGQQQRFRMMIQSSCNTAASSNLHLTTTQRPIQSVTTTQAPSSNLYPQQQNIRAPNGQSSVMLPNILRRAPPPYSNNLNQVRVSLPQGSNVVVAHNQQPQVNLQLSSAPTQQSQINLHQGPVSSQQQQQISFHQGSVSTYQQSQMNTQHVVASSQRQSQIHLQQGAGSTQQVRIHSQQGGVSTQPPPQVYTQQGTVSTQQYQQQHQQQGIPAPHSSAAVHSKQTNVNINMNMTVAHQFQARPVQVRTPPSLTRSPSVNALQGLQQHTIERPQRSMSLAVVQQQRGMQPPNQLYTAQQTLYHGSQQQQPQRSASPAVSSGIVPQSQGLMVYSSSLQQQIQLSNPTIFSQTNPHQGFIPSASVQSNVGGGPVISTVDATAVAYYNASSNQLPNSLGIGPIATVRLPVTAQMNPLANNRSFQMISSQNQQPPTLAITESNQGTITNQNTSFGTSNNNSNLGQSTSSPAQITASNQTSSVQQTQAVDVKPDPGIVVFVGPGNKTISENKPEPSSYKCPDCGLTFRSKTTLQDHQNEGMCF